MTYIVPNSVAAYANSVAPAIKVSLAHQILENSIVLGIKGVVYSEDDKFLAELVELPDTQQTVRTRRVGDYNPAGAQMYTTEIIFALSNEALNHIENLRHKNRKHDVILKFSFFPQVLVLGLKLGGYRLAATQRTGGIGVSVGYNQGEAILSDIKQADSSNINLNIPVVEDPNRLATYSAKKESAIHEIKSSDWVNDFQPVLGLGSFLVVEVSKPLLQTIPQTSLDSEQQKFRERLDRSYEILPDMEQSLRQGEWADVVRKSRGLLELFEKDVTHFVKQMLSKTTVLDEDKAGSLTMAIDKLIGYASELHHTVDSKGKVKDVYTAGKEDAYLVYLTSCALVNLLSKKFEQLVKA